MNQSKQFFAVLATLLVAGLSLVGCTDSHNPFAKDKPFVSTPVPTDFAVVIDESSDTYYARQDIRQVVTTTDLMSRTTYTTRRDYNDTNANQFTQEFPLSRAQVQAMWDEVVRYNLLENASTWYYWETNPDNYRRSERVIQIRANGKKAVYKQLNHWGHKLRDLAFEIEAARFPLNYGAPATAPAATTGPATTMSGEEFDAKMEAANRNQAGKPAPVTTVTSTLPAVETAPATTEPAATAPAGPSLPEVQK